MWSTWKGDSNILIDQYIKKWNIILIFISVATSPAILSQLVLQGAGEILS